MYNYSQKEHIFTKKSFKLHSIMKLNSTILLLIVTFGISMAQDKSKEYAASITIEDLRKHLTFIASDSLKGRDTGSEGQNIAARYIANHFESLGLLPIINSESGKKDFFQRFDLYQKSWTDAYLSFGKSKKEMFKDFYPNGLVNIPEEESVEVVFVGYGIENDKLNQYANVDVQGKAVVFFEGEPKDKNGNYIYSTNVGISDWSEKSGLQKKINIALNHGAKMFFVIPETERANFETQAAERKVMLSRYSPLSLQSANKMEKPSSNPTFFISKELAGEWFGMKNIQKASTNFTQLKKIKSAQISVKVRRGETKLQTQNVLALLEGTDKKDEIIVITAHYDHVGVQDGKIYNGADDDGSGTCAVLEIAEAFAKAAKEGYRPRRSILFMTVTGEEKGLFGSQYFTDINPAVPLKNIVCDLNIDMIGRIDKAHAPKEDYVYLIGSDKLSSELHQISEEVNEKYVKYQLDYTYNNPDDPNRFYYRSDHYNFAKNKIPVIFYFTGVHEDYHGPGDDVEKIMFPKYSEITKLVFQTAWELVNRENRIKVDSNKR